MATVTYFTDRSAAPKNIGASYVIGHAVIDFSENNVSATDVVQVMDIAAGTVVRNIYIYIVTNEGATCTATVGDATAAAGWDASVNLNATAGTLTQGETGTDALVDTQGTGEGKFYSTADTIDLTMGHDTDTAVIEVIAIGWHVNRAS